MARASTAFPVLRWVALLWLIVWLPLYVWGWGWENLVHLCDIAVILACIGLWFGSPLLVSSQALNALLAGFLWCLDAGWRLATGHHLIGGTEYMWDSHYLLGIRLLSLFHIALPLALLWAMQKVGYDPRALPLQTALTAVLLIFSRFLSPELNMNYAYRDPLFHRAWGPAPFHLAVILAGTIALLYWPTHFLLIRLFPNAQRTD